MTGTTDQNTGAREADTTIPPPQRPAHHHSDDLKEIGRLPSFATLRAIIALMLREMTSTYGRSPGGYIWAVLEPVMLIGVMVAIFSTGLRTPPLGTNFAIYYASGVMPYVMFMITNTKVSQAINYSKQLLEYPRVTFWDAIIARWSLTVIIQLAVSYIIFSIILLTMETRTILNLPLIANAFLMAALLGLGVGLLNCVLTSRYALWHTIWSVTNRPMIIISGVIIPIDRIPEPYRGWLEWNPVLHLVAQSRDGFYYSYDGAWIDQIYVYSFAIVCGFFGLMFVRRFFRNNMER